MARREKKKLLHNDEFLNLVSHELKTPLTSMLLFLHVLEDAVEDSNKNQQRALIAKTKKQMGKMIALINNLLDVAKLQSEQIPFVITKFNLDDLVTLRA